jgi:hypothetical protein
VALPEAVSILRTAGKHGTEHAMSAFATYLGHSTHNSGSFKRRLAAFRDWKFIAGGTGDRVVFTDLGRRVAYPTDPVKESRISRRRSRTSRSSGRSGTTPPRASRSA